jgi:ATP-binding cassette subfamily C protein
MDRIKATRITVAHRLSTIKDADRIFVMRDGTIAEEGDYETLMKMDGIFAKLARRQME